MWTYVSADQDPEKQSVFETDLLVSGDEKNIFLFHVGRKVC